MALTCEALERKDLLNSVGLDGPGLGNASLTYYIDSIPSNIDETRFRETIEVAFKLWSDVVDIEVSETMSARRREPIDIRFSSINSANGTLAELTCQMT